MNVHVTVNYLVRKVTIYVTLIKIRNGKPLIYYNYIVLYCNDGGMIPRPGFLSKVENKCLPKCHSLINNFYENEIIDLCKTHLILVDKDRTATIGEQISQVGFILFE